MNDNAPAEVWFPLSAAQRSRWFLYQFDPASQGCHNNSFAARMNGNIDRAVLLEGLQRIVARHPMLRAYFRSQNGEPRQCIAPAAKIPVLCFNVEGLADEVLQKRVLMACRQPFDLSQAPRIRANLYQRSKHETVILLVFDHIAVDGWSYWQILEELGMLLSSPKSGADIRAEAAQNKVSYLDYIVWQREWLASAAADGQRCYWQKQLGSELTVLQLPTERPRPGKSSGLQDLATLTLPTALTQQLHRLAHRQAGTLFTTLLAAYQILLHRYTGQGEIVVGSPMPGRRKPEWDRIVGDFVNPIALRAQFGGNPSVAEVLRNVRNTALRGMANQDYPFAKLVERFHSSREIGEHPFFQTMFVFQKARSGTDLRALWNNDECTEPIRWGGVELTSFPAHQSGGDSAISIVLEVMEVDDGVRCGFKFDADLFDPGTMARFAGYFVTLLGGMAEDEAQPVSRLPLLSTSQRRQLLVEFNDTRVDYPCDWLIQQLFESQAAKEQGATALVYNEQRLSYGELNRRANQVAHQLIALGVRPDQRVAICVERSPELVVGLLGILKAGGAYVPLDPSYPPDRVGYMRRDSAPVALLTQCALHGSLPGVDAPVIVLDAEQDVSALAHQPVHNPDPMALGLTSRHLAYVIYTSGSTGVPKGVMVEHSNVVSQVLAHSNTYSLTRTDRVLQFASFSFDSSVVEIFPALSVGATIVLRPSCLLAPDQAFVEFLQANRITVTDLPTAFWHQWAHEIRLKRNHPDTTLRLVVVGGEKAEQRHLASWLAESHHGCRWVNTYGPTETTVYATAIAFDSQASLPAHEIPIGRPIANTQIYILDSHLQPTPVGVAGELYIGGAGVARGYLNRPELTAERFIADSFSTDTGARLYKTGDLGRWLPDGNIEYLGRNDFQVKIRGFRIELGEIEAKLSGCVGVREAVVVAREDSPGDKRLVGYLVADDGAELSADELRSQLAGILPGYMVPSAFVKLAALPLTSNGKVDRRALPAPDQFSVITCVHEAPMDEIESEIARVWQELLGLDQVGRHDNFFDLGGHSLLATQVVSRLRLTVGVEVALRELFAQPTLAAFAQVVAKTGHAAPPPIVAADRSKPLPLSWAQERIFAIDQLEPGSPLYNMPAVLRLRGPLDTKALHRSIEEIVRRHETLRTTFTMGDGRPVQKIAPESEWTMLVEDLRPRSSPELTSEVTRLVHEEALRPFDITRGPLLRTRLLRTLGDEHLLLFTMHHIVSDGWSMGVIVRELSALYKAHRAGQAPALPELAIQYADFAVWQRTWISGRVLERELAYWVAQLKDAPAVELPTDRPYANVHTFYGKQQHFELSAELTASLERLSRAHGATLFMTLLAAFQVLLHCYSSQDDICVATSIANRTRAELEPLIGFFINRLVLRGRISKELTFASFLEQVRDTTLDAYAHQDVPFERVIDALGLASDPRRIPLCEAWFVLQNTPMPQLDLDGLVVEPLEVKLGRSKFDLALVMTEQSGGLAGTLEYKSDLFDEDTIAAMAGHFDVLVRAIAVNPQEALSRLPLLIVREREELLRTGQCRASSWKALPCSPSKIASPRHSDFQRNTTFNL